MSEKENKSSRLWEALRFCITGGVCFVIEFVCLLLFRNGIGLPTLVATPLAFLISVAVNYLLCVVWVFHAQGSGAAAGAGFVVTSLIGLLLNELFMWILGLLFQEDAVLLTVFGVSVTMVMVNKVISTLLVMIWNYFSKRAVLTWKKGGKQNV